MITILSGGTGSMKLVRGLSQICDSISVISNVGDNVWKYGLYICPDIDTILYGLSGQLDVQRGWGISGDTFNFMNQIGELGLENWFQIGDRDLATHVIRTELIRKGMSLTHVTEYFRSKYGLKARLLPVSDDSIETRIVTSRGEMNIQEFWIRYKAIPKVIGVLYKGAYYSKLTAGVSRLISSSERIIIAPANPISSIGPSLAIPGVKKALEKVKKKVIAISPLVGNQVFSGPAAKYMRAMKIDVSPLGIARYYSDIASSFVISELDFARRGALERLGLDVYLTNISMRSFQEERRLASYVAGIPENH